MNALLIPSLLATSITVPALASDCPFFGSLDVTRNHKCFIVEHQGYADTLTTNLVHPVVLSMSDYEKGVKIFRSDTLFIDGKCIVLLREDYDITQLFDAEDKCSKGFK